MPNTILVCMGLGCAIICIKFIFYAACELRSRDTTKKLTQLKCDKLLHSYINLPKHGGHVQQRVMLFDYQLTGCFILCSQL